MNSGKNLYILGCSLLLLSAGSALFFREEGAIALSLLFSLMGLSSIVGSRIRT